MFDWIVFEMECPVCKTKIDDFQSKDGGCSLDNLSPYEVFNFYSSCKKCGTWIDFIRKPKIEKPKLIPIDIILQDFDMEVKKNESII